MVLVQGNANVPHTMQGAIQIAIGNVLLLGDAQALLGAKALCAFAHCNQLATRLASGSARVLIRYGLGPIVQSHPCYSTGHPKPAFYCQNHAMEVASESDSQPKRRVECPVCRCMFGV